MVNLNRLIVQPIDGVIEVVQATLAKVSISCPYLFAFLCPCLGLTESVTLPVTAFLSALFVWALVSSLDYSAVSASHHVHPHHRFSVPSLFGILPRISYSVDIGCKCHTSCIVLSLAYTPPSHIMYRGEPIVRILKQHESLVVADIAVLFVPSIRFVSCR